MPNAELMRRPDTRQAAILLEGAIGEDDRRKMLSWVDPSVVDAFATLYWEANEFNDHDLLDWLDQELLMSAARRGWRANQVVDIQKGEQSSKAAQERYLDPTYGPAPQQAQKAEAAPPKRRWGG